MDWSYFWIPFITIVTAATGSLMTTSNLDWYFTLNLPSWTPSGGLIGVVWTVIFFLTAISAWLVWNHPDTHHADRRRFIALTFILNAFLNLFWTFLFFSLHLMGLAVWEAGVLGLSVALLIILIWPLTRWAALLLVPYLVWVTFATYLSYCVWALNR